MNGIDPWTGGKAPYPSNDGFLSDPQDQTLKPGETIIRRGNENGRFTSPEGTTFGERSLQLNKASLPENRYLVLKEIQVKAGPIAPHYNQPGKGTQYYFPEPDHTIRFHLKNGNLVQY